jgi:hypothetical protein
MRLIILPLFLLFAVSSAKSQDHSNTKLRSDTSNSDPLACTTLGYFLRGSEAPNSPAEWRRLLMKFGKINETGMVFSDAPGFSSLSEPRYLLAVSGSKADTKSLLPDFRHRLYMAFNLKWDTEKKEFVSTRTEFQTWNHKLRHFMFGIQDKNGNFHTLPIKNCNGCHKTQGPIFREMPWSNGNSEELRQPLKKALQELDAKLIMREFAYAPQPPAGYIDLLGSQEIYDDNVRKGAQLLRGSQLLVSLPAEIREEFTRKAFTDALLRRWKWQSGIEDAMSKVQSPNLYSHLLGTRAAKSLDPSILHSDILTDFTLERLFRSVVPKEDREVGSEEMVRLLSEARRKQTYVPPSEFSPMRSENFKKSRFGSEFLYAQGNSLILGATDTDPTVMYLSEAVHMILKKEDKAITPHSIAETAKILVDAIASEPPFRVWMNKGLIPERHELIPAMVMGLNSVLKHKYGIEHTFENPLPVDPYFKECDGLFSESATRVVVQDRCNRCHNGPNSLLELPFDPMDSASREKWEKASDVVVVNHWKQKLKKRVFETQSMPPPNEPEAMNLNLRGPDFESLRGWVESK